jgi:hypothetical protein
MRTPPTSFSQLVRLGVAEPLPMRSRCSLKEHGSSYLRGQPAGGPSP